MNHHQANELLAAADAVVERWHSIDWKQPHTRDFIMRLSAAVGDAKHGRAAPTSEPAVDRDAVLADALRNIRDYRSDVSAEIAARSMRFYAEQALEVAAPAAPAVPAVPANFCARCGKRLAPGSIHTCTPPSPSVDQAKRLVGGEVAAPMPDVLFDGMAVYEEITRKRGKSHCHSPETVSETLSAVVRLLRADRASTGSATSTDGGEDKQ